MRTLLLAERPFRDLRSRAALLDLPRRLPPETGTILVATRAPQAPAGFEPVAQDTDPATLGIGRVLLAGIFQERAAWESALAQAARAVAAGARLEIMGLTLERAAARRDLPAGIGVLDHAASLEVRDHPTANVLLVWRVAMPARIAFYPERLAPAEDTLAAMLPPGPLLGLSMLAGPNRPEAPMPWLHPLLAQAEGWPVLPLPAEGADTPLDDLAGSLAFAATTLPGARLLLPELANPVWRRRQLTPGRLRGLVGRCALVLTSQDLVAALAVTADVPVIGAVTGPDRRIVACLTTLANELPPGSALAYPPSRDRASARA
jgi:hypothetical protein